MDLRRNRKNIWSMAKNKHLKSVMVGTSIIFHISYSSQVNPDYMQIETWKIITLEIPENILETWKHWTFDGLQYWPEVEMFFVTSLVTGCCNRFSNNLLRHVTSFISIRHVAKGGRRGRPPPPPPGGQEGFFSARCARRKGPTRPREAQFLESLEVLRATRALSERPEGPMDVQRAPVQEWGPFNAREGPFERSERGPFEAPPPPLGEILATCLISIHTKSCSWLVFLIGIFGAKFCVFETTESCQNCLITWF